MRAVSIVPLLLIAAAASTAMAQRDIVYPRAVINSQSPSEGSVLGGTRITFVGEWLGDSNTDVSVFIGAGAVLTTCARVAYYSSETRLVCETDAFDSRATLSVTVLVRGQEATCSASSGCTFRFTEDATPVVADVSPEVVAAPARVAVSGSDFDLGDVNVEHRDFAMLLGTARCALADGTFSHNAFQCDATTEVPSGSQPVALKLSRRGTARSNAVVPVVPTVQRVVPLAGSAAGGQTLSIYGSGFDTTASRNRVTVHGATCGVTKSTGSHIECVTSPHAATSGGASAGTEGQAAAEFFDWAPAGDIDALVASRNALQPTAQKTVAAFGGDNTFPDVAYGGVRYTAQFVPPTDGVYVFEVRGDDWVELWLSESSAAVPRASTQVDPEDPYNPRRIAHTTRYRSGFGQEAAQRSDNVTLFANQTYWMRAILKNNGGGMGCAVRVTLPSGEQITNPGGRYIRADIAIATGVAVHVGGTPAVCHGACIAGAAAFHYSATATPTVTAVSPTTIAAGTSTTITGTGFDANGDNVVTAGAAACTLVSSTTTQIVCAFAEAPAGTVALRVRVGTVGFAAGSGTVTGTMAITAVSPATGSVTGGTLMTVTGSGFGSAAAGVAVDFGGAACTIASLTNSKITCTTTAHAAGAATVTVTRNQGTVTAATKSVAFAETRPNTVAATARLLAASGSVNGVTISAVAPGNQFTQAADATVALVSAAGSVACPTIFALGDYVTCRAPYHTPGSVNVTVNSLLVGAYNFVESVREVRTGGFGPTGGNWARVELDVHGTSRNVSVSVGGAPCEGLRWASDSAVDCYAGPRATTVVTGLPVLLAALGDASTAATELAQQFEHDGASVTAAGDVYLPAGKVLTTKLNFNRPIVFTASVRPTAAYVDRSSSCVYMRALPRDSGAKDSGYVGYAGRDGARLGLGSSGTRNWMPSGPIEFEAGTPTQSVGLNPTQWAEWKLEIRNGGARFFVDGVEIASAGDNGIRRGPVGFGHSCQAVLLRNFTVRDLTGDSVQVTVDGRAIPNAHDVSFRVASATSVKSFATTATYGNEIVGFELHDNPSTWRLSAHALATNDAHRADDKLDFCGSFGYIPDTNIVQCRVSSSLPPASYTVRLRDYYGGYAAEAFTVAVRPTILNVTPAVLPPAGGFVVVEGRNLPHSAADGVSFTLGATAVTVEEYAAGAYVVLRVPAVAAGTHTLQSANSRCSGTCSLAVSSTDAPTATSVSPATLTDIDHTVYVSGTNFGNYGRVYIGTHLCTVYWSSATQLKCTLRTVPAAGTHAVTVYPGLRAATGSLSITVAHHTAGLASGSTVGAEGGALVAFSGIFDTAFATTAAVFSEDYAATAATTTLTGFTPRFDICAAPIGRYLNSADGDSLTKTLAGIAAHTTLTVAFDAVTVDNSAIDYIVSIDGTEYDVVGEAYCPSYSLCGWSSRDCVSPTSVTVPHTAATATIAVRAASKRSWGIKGLAVTAGGASSYAATLNSLAMPLHHATPYLLVFTAPAVAAGTYTPALTHSSAAMSCTSCDVTVGTAGAPAATNFYQGTHPATGVSWVSSDGVEHTSGATPSISRVRGSYGWDQGAHSAEQYAAGTLTGVTFTFTAANANCRQMFGLSSGADTSDSYTDIGFAIYNNRGRFEVYESGRHQHTAGSYATTTTMGIRCADATCTRLEYTADGVVVFRSSTAPVFPLRLDSSFDNAGCGVAQVALTRPAASTTYPVYVAGTFSRAHDTGASVTIAGSNCPVVGVRDGLIVCNAPAAVASPAAVVITSLGRGISTTAAATASAIAYGVTRSTGGTNGGTRVQIKGAGFASPAFNICGTAVASTADAVTCETAAAAAATVNVTAAGVACAGACSTFEHRTSDDATLTSVTPTTITAGTDIVVLGTNFASGSVLRLADGIDCANASVSGTNFTCRFAAAVPAGTYSAVVASPLGKTTAVTVTAPLTVTAAAPAAFGTLGGGKLVIRGTGLSAAAALKDSSDAALCSAVALNAAGAVECTVAAFGSVPPAPYTLHVGSQSAAVAITISASENPTVTAVTPSTVAGGDVVAIAGTKLTTGATVAFGGVACGGVTAAADGLSASCTVSGALTLGTHAVTVASAAGAGTSSVTVTARFAIHSIAATTTSSSVTVTATASAVDTGVAYTAFVGGSACTVSATTATTVVCSTANPATFSGDWHDFTLATPTAATATSSFTFDAAASPTVTAISPTSGTAAGGDDVTITGTLFDLNPQNNAVTIGTSRCYVYSVTSTRDSLVCTTEPQAVDATAAVSVNVAGLGAASSSTTFDYQLTITAATFENSATSVSVEGGVSVTLAVSGLPQQQTNVQLTIGYSLATITAFTATHVTATVPAAPRDHTVTPAIQSVQADYTLRADVVGVIRLTANGITAAVNDAAVFVDYKQTATPRITAVSIAETAATVPETALVIDGTDFAATGNEVTVVDQRTGNSSTCTITAEAATQITCTLNTTYFGRGRVVVRRPGWGNAYTARTCPSGAFLACDGQCLTDADCVRSDWGRAGCNDLMQLLYGETYCHSKGGSDLIDRPLLLDNGRTWDFNCPLYRCEGTDCNKTLNYAGRAPRISTCGADPNGHYITMHPEITAIVGAKTSSVLGGQRYTLTGRGFIARAVVRVGPVAARVLSVTYSSMTVETLPVGGDVANATFALSQDGAAAVCAAAVCGGFYFNVSVTPMASAVAYNRSHPNQHVTVTGTGFAATNEVTIGGAVCTIVSQSATQIVCQAPSLPMTERYTYHDVLVRAVDTGYANLPSSDSRVRYLPVVTAVAPTSGSTQAGQLVTFTGFAFAALGSVDAWFNWGCSASVVSATDTQLVLRTTQACSGTKSAAVRAFSEYATCAGTCSYTYSSSATPAATSHDVTATSAGSTINLVGTWLSTTVGDFTVTVGDASCSGVSLTGSTLSCTAPTNAVAGTHAVRVLVNGYGYASGLSTAEVTHGLAVTSFTPTSGSLGGGQSVTVTGTGFPSVTTGLAVSTAGVACAVQSSTNTQIVCTTAASSSAATGTVFVGISAAANTTSTGSYSYSASLTATVSAITPGRGSTAGGTMLTIAGTGLSTSHAVTIAGVTCAQSAAEQAATTATAYYCTTGAHASQLSTAVVTVSTGTEGNAQIAADATYQYVDLWSRRTTWNGYAPPVRDDSVVIGENQTVMLDYSPPRLVLIVVQGHLVFDPTADITLEARYIVVHFGRMTIGTEASPYTKRAVIRLFADRLSPEIPLAGAKTLLVYKGRFDMHGVRRTTWSRLAATAAAGSNSITLRGDVQWNAGEEIVIGPTGFEMLEAEPRFIDTATYNSGANTTTVTFAGALRYQHWGVNQCFGSSPAVCVDESAEVILLTRNILFTGDDDSYTNTFGATTMFRPLGQDENRTIRVSYVEFTKVGQAFMLGRYPIHFHIPGDANNSYIEGCSVHRSLQRAITIHGVNNATFRNNVVYDTLGHSIFWEDGSERHNVAEDNVVFVTRVSTSSLNSDTTPANYWLTNPMNYLRRNVAGGATFYGFWISPMVPHATGPSGGSHICPQTTALGAFEDNRAHSNGNYGLQVKPDWFPKRVQCNSGSGDEPAVLRRLTSYKNHIHGVNFMTIGAITLDGYVAADIGTTDLESSLVWNEHVTAINQSAGVRNAVFIAYTANQPYHRTTIRRGINLPLSDNYFIENATFVNMENENWAFEPFRRQKRMSLNYPWAWEFVTSGLRFINAQQRLRYRFQHHSIANDMDGTLGGYAGYQVVPQTPFFDNQPACTFISGWNSNYPTYTCAPSFKIRRIGIARSERGGNQNWTIGNVSEIVYRLKGGYLVSVPINGSAHIDWLEAEGPNEYRNFFNARYMRPAEHYRFVVTHKEARVDINGSFNGRQPLPLDAPPALSHNESAWHYDRPNNTIHALLRMPDTQVQVNAYRCPPEGCLLPGGPAPVNKSCEPFGVAASWYAGAVPTYDANVTYNDSICIDSSIATWPDVHIGALTVGGRLHFRDEFCPADNATVRIFIDRWVHIKGGEFLIGNATHPVTRCRVEIIMGRVDHTNYTDVRRKSLYMWGSRAFALEYGTIGFHAATSNATVAYLAAPATAGGSTLQLDRAVDWRVGDVVGIAQTTRNAMFLEGDQRTEESERANVTAVSADRRTVTISIALVYTHHGEAAKVLNGTSYIVGAEVALLSRNVVIHGGHWDGEPIPYDAGWQLNLGCTPQNYEGCAGGSVDSNGYPMSPLRPGVVHLEGIEFRDVGQKGKRHAAVEFDGVRGNTVDTNYMRNCAVHRAFAVAISLRDASEPVLLEGNTVFDTQGDGIRVASVNNTLANNLVMVGRVPTSFCASIYVPRNPDCWPALFRVTAHNTLTNNTAASAVAIGYETEGTPCSDAVNTWRGNRVHSVRDGLHVMDGPAVADYRWPAVSFSGGCRRVGGVVAFSNADHGATLWFPVGDHVQVSHIVSVDNAVGFTAAVVSSAVDVGQTEMQLNLTDSVFAGQWPGHACTGFAYKCRKTKVDDAPWCKSFQDKAPRMGNIGLFETVFMSSHTGRTLGEHYFMWHEPDGYAVVRAKARYTNLFFDHFDGANTCGTKTVGIYQNPFSNDTHHQHAFAGIRYGSGIVNGGEMWAKTTYGPIPGHLTHGVPPQQTYFMDFDNQRFGAFWPDAPNKIWMIDEDGSLTRSAGRVDLLSSQSLTRNSTWASMGKWWGVNSTSSIGAVRDGCTFNAQWNMFTCDSARYKWLNLVVESTASDAWTRRVGPLVLCKGAGMTLANGDPICEHGVVDFVGGPLSKSQGHRGLQLRMSRFRFLVENGGNYTLHFRGSPPSSTRYHLTNWEHTGLAASDIGVVINTRIYGAFSHSRLAVYVDGRKERPVFGFGFPHEFGLAWPAPTDRAGTHYHDKYVTPLLHRNVMSFSMRPGVVMDLRHEMIIQINMDLAIPMSEFFNRKDTFALALANALGIQGSTLRFAKIVPGTSRRQATSSATSVALEVDGGDTPLNTSMATAIKARMDTLAQNTSSLSTTLNTTVIAVTSAVVHVADPEPAVYVLAGYPYLLFYATHDAAALPGGFNTTAVQAAFIAHVRAANTNSTLVALADTTTVAVGNVYTYPGTSLTRFTVLFTYLEAAYNTMAMATLNTTANANAASLFPANYAYVNHTYSENTVFKSPVNAPITFPALTATATAAPTGANTLDAASTTTTAPFTATTAASNCTGNCTSGLPDAPASPNASSSRNNTLIIIAVVVAIIVVAGIAIGIAVAVSVSRARKQQEQDAAEAVKVAPGSPNANKYIAGGGQCGVDVPPTIALEDIEQPATSTASAQLPDSNDDGSTPSKMSSGRDSARQGLPDPNALDDVRFGDADGIGISFSVRLSGSVEASPRRASSADVRRSSTVSIHVPDDQQPDDGCVDADADLRAMFDAFDRDGSGTVSLRELKAALCSRGAAPMAEADVDAMFARVDDGDGELSYPEFVRCITGLQSAGEESPRDAW